jgi:histidyl-tRNA synthetase
MNTKIQPKTLKGFRDYFAEDVNIRQYIKQTFQDLAQSYGYEGLETPALEYSELILGISGSEAEKLYYRFQDHGGRDVMLKYELMTSMCRAIAQSINEIHMPYKRYQMQNVWRADNVQKGR